MKLNNRFNQAVQFLKSIINPRENIELLTCINIIQKKDLITFESCDQENFLRIKLPLFGCTTEGSYAINAAKYEKLTDKIATNISSKTVQFNKVTLPNQYDKSYPSIHTEFFKQPLITFNNINKADFLSYGKKVSKFVSKDQTRLSLTGTLIRGKYQYATDGRKVIRLASLMITNKEHDLILPMVIYKFLSSSFILEDVLSMSLYKHDETYSLLIKGTSFELITRLINDSYPDIESVLPKSYDYSFNVDRSALLSIINEALPFTKNENNEIRLSSTNNKRLEIKTIHEDNEMVFLDTMKIQSRYKKKWNGIHVNAKYLLQILTDCNGKNIEINTGGQQPIAIKTDDKKQFFILMPIKNDNGSEPEEKSNKENTKEKK